MRAGQKPAQIFRNWDSNGDGFLDYDEFVNAYTKLQESVSIGVEGTFVKGMRVFEGQERVSQRGMEGISL